MKDIHLFIGGKEVEFSSDPKILFNYKETELHNPTIVRNNFTKSITIDGTPTNNDIFGNIWNLERTQFSSLYNPMQKVGFELYMYGELIENGYVKLDSIKKSNNKISYSVTLYGGLGDFFHNLSYLEGTDKKKSLANLAYKTYDNDDDPNLDFIINKDTVAEAWNAINGVFRSTPYDDKWSVINFIPCYNGIPSDFDANKVMINRYSVDAPNSSPMYMQVNDGDPVTGARPILNGAKNLKGWSVGELPEALTADETFDLRSYLQRPVVNVYRVLQACAHPENNGGYEVIFDPHFFNTNNPYYFGKNAWVTLPMLRDLEVEGAGEATEITGATLTRQDGNHWNLNYEGTAGQLNNVRIRVNVAFTPGGSTNADQLYSYYHFYSSAVGVLRGSTYVRHYYDNDAVNVQLVGRDANGNILTSKLWCLGWDETSVYNNKRKMWDGFGNPYDDIPDPTDAEFVKGYWKLIDGQYIFCDTSGNRKDIEFTFPQNSNIVSVQLYTQNAHTHYTKFKFSGSNSSSNPNISFLGMYKKREVETSVRVTEGEARTDYGKRVTGTTTFILDDFYAISTDYEKMFSGSYIPKDKILSTSFTPAEALISYCKMFGLYFYRDPKEVSSNPERYPNGVIHIMDRDTFYTDEYVNLEPLIDRSKDMTITPVFAASKWYSFSQEPIESEANDDYKSTYGYDYGRQLVNTNYNFDDSTTNLLDKNVFKSGVMVREKDKYFAKPIKIPYNNGGWMPIYMFNGMKYCLYNQGDDGLDKTELELNKRVIFNTKTPINDLDLKNYDSMPKLQCHGTGNDPVDGDGVLMFYQMEMSVPVTYYITDDVPDMGILNEGTPCWIATGGEYDAAGNRIAISATTLPYYTRDLFNGYRQEGYVSHSWNFGMPMATFSPNTYNTIGDNIYNFYWKSYINDMYDQDTKKLTCYVRIDNRPDSGWLRKWYVFDNCIWRLNEIKDWNAGDWGTTQCEFIRVQDIDNYKLEAAAQGGVLNITASPLSIPQTGGDVTYTVTVADCGRWFILQGEPDIQGIDQQGNRYSYPAAVSSGEGCETTFTQHFSASTSYTPITWTLTIEDGYEDPNRRASASIMQMGTGSTGDAYIEFTQSEMDIDHRDAWYSAAFTKAGIVDGTISASTNSDWCTVGFISTQDGYSNIQFHVTENTGTSTRGAVIHLWGRDTTGGTHNTYLDVLQNVDGLQIDTTSVTFNYWDGDTSNTPVADIRSNKDWTITINDE